MKKSRIIGEQLLSEKGYSSPIQNAAREMTMHYNEKSDPLLRERIIEEVERTMKRASKEKKAAQVYKRMLEEQHKKVIVDPETTFKPDLSKTRHVGGKRRRTQYWEI